MRKAKYVVSFEGYKNLRRETTTRKKANEYIDHICELFGWWMNDHARIEQLTEE